MAAIKEWRCAAHGEFEGPEPLCPGECPPQFITQEFRTPVSIRSGKTRFVDQQLRGLANDYRLPDIQVDRDGASVMESLKSGTAKEYKPTFVPIPHATPGWSRRGEKPLAQGAAPLLFGRGGENAIENYNNNGAAEMRGPITKPKPLYVNPPNPAPEVLQ